MPWSHPGSWRESPLGFRPGSRIQEVKAPRPNSPFQELCIYGLLPESYIHSIPHRVLHCQYAIRKSQHQTSSTTSRLATSQCRRSNSLKHRLNKLVRLIALMRDSRRTTLRRLRNPALGLYLIPCWRPRETTQAASGRGFLVVTVCKDCHALKRYKAESWQRRRRASSHSDEASDPRVGLDCCLLSESLSWCQV